MRFEMGMIISGSTDRCLKQGQRETEYSGLQGPLH